MTKNIKGNARRERFPFFHFLRVGYTLVETLTVIMIIGILAGAFAVVYRGVPTQSQAPEREAQKLSHWLTNLATISNRTGRPFLLNCPGNVTRDYIEVIWQSPLKKDTYASAYGCGFSRYGGGNVESFYSPQWSAMAPTITIKVSRGKTEHYVIVSQHGRVRTDRRPP